jgi:hypothetical protein
MPRRTAFTFAFVLTFAFLTGGGVALADPFVDPPETPCYGGAYCDGAGPGFGVPPNPWDPTGGQDPSFGDLLQQGFNTLWDDFTNTLPTIMYAVGCAWDC